MDIFDGDAWSVWTILILFIPVLLALMMGDGS